MSPQQHYRLTHLVKRALDLARILVLGGAIAWLVVVVIVGLGIPPDPEARHTDISAYLGFRVNTVEGVDTGAANVGAGELLLSGHGDLWLNNTRSWLAWWVSGAITELLVLFLLYGVLLARRLFASLAAGETFNEANAEYVRKLGWTVVGWNIVAPLMQYFGGRLILQDIAYDAPGIELYAGFEMGIGGLLSGLAILVLAGVLREAVSIHEDQSLTI